LKLNLRENDLAISTVELGNLFAPFFKIFIGGNVIEFFFSLLISVASSTVEIHRKNHPILAHYRF
jgi:hypothetical protein